LSSPPAASRRVALRPPRTSDRLARTRHLASRRHPTAFTRLQSALLHSCPQALRSPRTSDRPARTRNPRSASRRRPRRVGAAGNQGRSLLLRCRREAKSRSHEVEKCLSPSFNQLAELPTFNSESPCYFLTRYGAARGEPAIFGHREKAGQTWPAFHPSIRPSACVSLNRPKSAGQRWPARLAAPPTARVHG